MKFYIIKSAWNYDSGGEVFGVWNHKATAIKVAKLMKGHHDEIQVFETNMNPPIPGRDGLGDYDSLNPIWRGD